MAAGKKRGAGSKPSGTPKPKAKAVKEPDKRFAGLFDMDQTVVKGAGIIQSHPALPEGATINQKLPALRLMERKALTGLILFARKIPTDSEYHEAPLSSLCEAIGIDHNDRTNIKRRIRDLMNRTFEWNVMDRDGTEVTWKAANVLSEVEITQDGMVRWAFAPTLRKAFLAPERYAQLSLESVRMIKSPYAFTLYEICKLNVGVGTTGWWPVDMWRKVLWVTGKSYKEFKNLRRLLNRAVDEINEVTEIIVTIKTDAAYRVKKLGFDVRLKKPTQAALPLPDKEDEKQRVLELLLKHKVKNATAKKMVDQYPPRYLQEKVGLLEDQLKKGVKIKSPAGWLVKAAKEDFRGGKEEAEKVAAEKEVADRQRLIMLLRVNKYLVDNFRSNREAQRDKALKELKKDEQKTLETRFYEEVVKKSPTLRNAWVGAESLSEPMIGNQYLMFLENELLFEASEVDMRQFATDEGEDWDALQAEIDQLQKKVGPVEMPQ